jgi:DHA1 family multidrug resistance protein-like MFS transporter
VGKLGRAVSTIASAVGKDIQTAIICRFFVSLFGASQLSVVPTLLSDIYYNSQRGISIAIYSLTVFVGPFIAPFIGGFIASSLLVWRWTLYISAFMSFTCGILFVLFLKETYSPGQLSSKAVMIRR